MVQRNIVVIGASAGGVTALQELLGQLPADFGAAIFVVQHLSAQAPSHLPQILGRAGKLPTRHPQDGDPILPGHIYVSVPDHHLLIEEDRVLVKKGPKENRFRPSIDALFRSAAYTYGPRVIGVVLTGLLDDGTSGMWSIKRFGGVSIVQQPDDAQYPSMPASVLQYVDVDYTVPLADIGALLCRLVGEPVSGSAPNGVADGPPASEPAVSRKDESAALPEEYRRMQTEIQIAAHKNAFDMGILDMGQPTNLTCPSCNGVLVSIREGRLLRYRCHTGHGFTADSLLAELEKSVEETHWQVVRGLEEAVVLLEQMAATYESNGFSDEAGRFRQKADETRQRSRHLQKEVFSYGVKK